MKNLYYLFLTGFIVICSYIPILNGVAHAEYVPGEILIKLKGAAEIAEINGPHNKFDSVSKKQSRKSRLHHLKLDEDVSVEEAIEFYKQDPNVEYAEPNYIIRLNAIPNDIDFNLIWRLHNTGQTGGSDDADIDAPEAWDLTTGSDNIIIAVIDSGIALHHPDLQGNIWTNPGETDCSDNIDNDNNGYVDDCNGWDFLGKDNEPIDFNGHGSHVSGIIAAVGNNNEGITGIMWQAKIMPLRFFGLSGSGTVANAVSAILYANANGAHVINLSWGGSNYSQSLKDAIDASDAVIVCAAGNIGSDNDATPFYPAGYDSPNIISVAATDNNDNLAYFSNYGAETVDIGAPGVSIYSTVPVFSYGNSITVFNGEDFDADFGELPLSGWNRGGTNSTWTITNGTGYEATNSLEDSPGGNYADNTASWAGYMTPITSVKDNIYTLTFKWKGDLENNYDYLDINYSEDGINWDWIDYRTGTTDGIFISDSSTSFTDTAEILDTFYFGFGLSSDYSNSDDGVYLDNIELKRTPIYIDDYSYRNISGTSAAAPHVAGVAGLLKAFKPELTNLEIINAILSSADPKDSLAGKVSSDGRVNAYNALQNKTSMAGNSGSSVSDEPANTANKSGGGCFIATAAYGSKMHPYVKDLSRFRDRHLLTNTFGKAFVNFYYKHSPPIADFIRDRDSMKLITRGLLIPLVMFVVFPNLSLGIFITFLTAAAIFLRKRFKGNKIPISSSSPKERPPFKSYKSN